MWTAVLILMALLVLSAGAFGWRYWQSKKKPPLQLVSSGQSQIHAASQQARLELVKVTEAQIKAVEAMDHDALRNALRDRDAGNN